MRKLFRKFMIIISITVVGSVVAMALILNAFGASPVIPELEAQKREIILDLTQTILQEQGEDEARRFVTASEAARPLGLTIIPTVDDSVCEPANRLTARAVQQGGTCYQISVLEAEGIVPSRLAPTMLGLAILISSVAAAALLVRSLVSPVILLKDGLSALAQGRFDIRIGETLAPQKDEISDLGRDFDLTALRLQQNHEAQQRLFHDVSHELRSPLSRLQAATGILRKTPARLDVMLERMDREVERLDRLVGEVLTLARLTVRSDDPLRVQDLDVIEILNEILADAAFEAQARSVTITTDVDGSFLARVDGELIYRSLENVIRNATKYTAERSHVSVDCRVQGNLLEVRVTDHGPGVEPGDVDRIFEPFTRSGDVLPVGGHGLGLAIARSAITKHGGEVYAELPTDGGLVMVLKIPSQ
ncbi:two-component sensor histidine kinase [Thioclava sp. L04-15]|uniref:HAMP domain-containing sensor histidine kinase n=1 Tax=Thioclava sp. L04-15 TaxID=1915318 RepID=UPI00099611F7|nr:ATP-binding protein [Thioclava sp. L04-15]OOY28438.1 two-component sensor histidine kinase [Thioclava sp. L04-15]